MKDLEKLSDRELDALIDARLMGRVWDESRCRTCGWVLVAEDQRGGCRKDDCSLRPPPDRRADTPAEYSNYDHLARLVRDRVSQLGLIAEYRMALAKLVWPPTTPPSQFKGADEFAFLFEQATPRQQCIAALKAQTSPTPSTTKENK